uniref:Uncharacterized protein n=1 Tax=Anopheles quadriannulatus TaxID=34691 RepID=A0A182WRU0_ANOQN
MSLPYAIAKASREKYISISLLLLAWRQCYQIPTVVREGMCATTYPASQCSQQTQKVARFGRWEHTVGGAGLFKCGAFCGVPMGCFQWNSRVSPHKSSPDHVSTAAERPAKKRDVRTINSSSSDLGPPSKTNGAQPARSSAARAAAAL